MAIVACDECGKEISDKASACIGCGAPVMKIVDMSQDANGYPTRFLNEDGKPRYTNKDGTSRAPFDWEADRDGVDRAIYNSNPNSSSNGHVPTQASNALSTAGGILIACLVILLLPWVGCALIVGAS